MPSTLRLGVPSYRVSYPLDLPGECGARLMHLGSAHAHNERRTSLAFQNLECYRQFPGRHYRSLFVLYITTPLLQHVSQRTKILEF